MSFVAEHTPASAGKIDGSRNGAPPIDVTRSTGTIGTPSYIHYLASDGSLPTGNGGAERGGAETGGGGGCGGSGAEPDAAGAIAAACAPDVAGGYGRLAPADAPMQQSRTLEVRAAAIVMSPSQFPHPAHCQSAI